MCRDLQSFNKMTDLVDAKKSARLIDKTNDCTMHLPCSEIKQEILFKTAPDSTENTESVIYVPIKEMVYTISDSENSLLCSILRHPSSQTCTHINKKNHEIDYPYPDKDNMVTSDSEVNLVESHVVETEASEHDTDDFDFWDSLILVPSGDI